MRLMAYELLLQTCLVMNLPMYSSSDIKPSPSLSISSIVSCKMSVNNTSLTNKIALYKLQSYNPYPAKLNN